jgi:hypothetical protein
MGICVVGAASPCNGVTWSMDQLISSLR